MVLLCETSVGVHTDPGKVWNILEFNVKIVKALKMIIGMETLEKFLKTVMLTWKMQMSITLLIAHAFVNFLAVHDTQHLKFRVQIFESHSVFRIEEYIV